MLDICLYDFPLLVIPQIVEDLGYCIRPKCDGRHCDDRDEMEE